MEAADQEADRSGDGTQVQMENDVAKPSDSKESDSKTTTVADEDLKAESQSEQPQVETVVTREKTAIIISHPTKKVSKYKSTEFKSPNLFNSLGKS